MTAEEILSLVRRYFEWDGSGDFPFVNTEDGGSRRGELGVYELPHIEGTEWAVLQLSSVDADDGIEQSVLAAIATQTEEVHVVVSDLSGEMFIELVGDAEFSFIGEELRQIADIARSIYMSFDLSDLVTAEEAEKHFAALAANKGSD